MSEELRSKFNQFDGDGNGQIDLAEFRNLLGELGEELDSAAAEAKFDAIDVDENGLIDFDEFSAWWSSRQQN